VMFGVKLTDVMSCGIDIMTGVASQLTEMMYHVLRKNVSK